MDSFSRHAMLGHFEEMIKWRTMNRDSVKFNWTEYHLSVVRGYVLKLSLNSDFKLLSLAKLLKDAFRLCMPRSSIRKAASFAQDLQKFFVVPKQYQLFERDDALEQNELAAAFINMLLLLLHGGEVSVNSVEDSIDCLEEELRFLLTVLGDRSLICAEENKQVKNLNLLAEIEAVANEAGCLVHSVVFSTFADPMCKTMDERLGVLLHHMHLLKDNINKFSNLQRVLAQTNTTPRTAAVDSDLFIIGSLLYDIADLLNREDEMIADVKDQIEELQQELEFSQSFIEDIKMSRHSEMEEMKERMMRIRDSAYEAEYLINSFLVGNAPLWYLSSRLSHVIHKIKLTETAIKETKQNYDVGASNVATNIIAQLSLKKKSFEVDDIIVGFENEATDILDHLEGGKEHLQIISIFGMPGLGKTTLARKLYNHPLVKYKFDKCSWCVVSQTYHTKHLLVDILVSLKGELDKYRIQDMEEEGLLEQIYRSLKGRRYLIVMDDIWSSSAWYDLRRCFPDDGNGSRILFTGRNKDVAPPDSITYELPCMSDEQCWELLEKKVFHDEPCPPQLVKTGKKIATNCGGSPLAVVVVAGILSSMDKEVSTWENVGRNLASYIFSDQNNSMMQILELSYKHLRDHLKPCFLYFGLFPEDREIPVKKLKRLWMAEGFIHEEKKQSAENVAEEYLMELIDKSLVTVAKRRPDGGVKTCIIHDLLRDLCFEISKEDNFLKLVDENYSIYEKRRRLCLRVSNSQISPPFGLHVRSLFGYLGSSAWDILNMKLLRVLEAIVYSDNQDEIEPLVHLRYLKLNFRWSSVGSLTWIGSLVNLEFLVVETLNLYSRIPLSVLMKMMKLRYVKFNKLIDVDSHCNGFEANNLEFLSCVEITSLRDKEILKCSPHLRTLKCIVSPLWVEEQGKYHYLDFGFLTELESLNLALGTGPRLQDISLPLNIKRLTLCRLGLPWEKMSTIGRLPNLQVLKLSFFAFVGEMWETGDGEFQQLKFLKLYCLELAHWNVASSEHFPKIQQLVLHNCDMLHEIPSEMGEIATLHFIEVKGWCQESLVESARQIEREQRDMGNEGLSFMFTNIYER